MAPAVEQLEAGWGGWAAMLSGPVLRNSAGRGGNGIGRRTRNRRGRLRRRCLSRRHRLGRRLEGNSIWDPVGIQLVEVDGQGVPVGVGRWRHRNGLRRRRASERDDDPHWQNTFDARPSSGRSRPPGAGRGSCSFPRAPITTPPWPPALSASWRSSAPWGPLLLSLRRPPGWGRRRRIGHPTGGCGRGHLPAPGPSTTDHAD